MPLSFQVIQTELKMHNLFSQEMTQKFPKNGAED
jgi:hypothetical protein